MILLVGLPNLYNLHALRNMGVVYLGLVINRLRLLEYGLTLLFHLHEEIVEGWSHVFQGKLVGDGFSSEQEQDVFEVG